MFRLLGVALCALAIATSASAQQKLDGRIFLKEADVPNELWSPSLPGETRGPRFSIDRPRAGTKSVIYERALARWKDITTLPQSREECVDWAWGDIPFDGQWKTCIGWKVQWRWMYTTAYVRIATADQADIGTALDDCLKTAACAGALAGIISGGSAAITTFEGVLKACLVSKLPSLISVAAWTSSGWGDWE